MSVLVVGASGSFGGAVARELVARGHRVSATVRPGGRSVAIPTVRCVEADVTDEASLQAAARGAEVIVYGFNAPYDRWEQELLPATHIMARVAVATSALLVLPGNVYGLGPDYSEPLAEDAARDCPSRKGELRNAMEEVLEGATAHGARLLIVRAGDYFGPDARDTSWFHFMTRRVHRGGALLQPAPDGVLHAWAYLPDLAATTVRLLERRTELSPSEVFHFAGHTLTGEALLDEVRAQIGDPQRRIVRVPWWLVSVAGWMSPVLREVVKMRYLWREPVRLDERKLRGFLGSVPHTPLPEAVHDTLAAHAQAQGATSARAQVRYGGC